MYSTFRAYGAAVSAPSASSAPQDQDHGDRHAEHKQRTHKTDAQKIGERNSLLFVFVLSDLAEHGLPLPLRLIAQGGIGRDISLRHIV